VAATLPIWLENSRRHAPLSPLIWQITIWKHEAFKNNRRVNTGAIASIACAGRKKTCRKFPGRRIRAGH
jgi:hypothetical protein